MGIQALKLIVDHIIMSNENWEAFLRLPLQVKNDTINWVLKITRDEEGHFYDYNSDKIREVWEKMPDYVDERGATFFLLFTSDYDNFDDYLAMVKRLVVVKSCYEEAPKITDVKLSNVIFTYYVGKEFSLAKLALHLQALEYSTVFSNWQKHKLLRVVVPLGVNGDKIKSHRFLLYKNGMIRHISPANIKESKEEMERLLTNIRKCM
jgi:hypothetical protein